MSFPRFLMLSVLAAACGVPACSTKSARDQNYGTDVGVGYTGPDPAVDALDAATPVDAADGGS